VSVDPVEDVDDGILVCSFCMKGQSEVFRLIAGPSAFICEGCVSLCVQIILEDLAPRPNRGGEQP
jgi:ATP-dependent Clp protease ATP-binding subunit ClpX